MESVHNAEYLNRRVLLHPSIRYPCHLLFGLIAVKMSNMLFIARARVIFFIYFFLYKYILYNILCSGVRFVRTRATITDFSRPTVCPNWGFFHRSCLRRLGRVPRARQNPDVRSGSSTTRNALVCRRNFEETLKYS